MDKSDWVKKELKVGLHIADHKQSFFYQHYAHVRKPSKPDCIHPDCIVRKVMES